MVFSSMTFLFAFLPVVVLVYMLSPKQMKNAILLGEEDNNGIFKYDFFICISACCGFGVHA